MTVGSTRRTLRNIAVVATLVAGSIGAVLPGTAAAEPDTQAVAPVTWGPCAPGDISNVPPAEQSKFSCANYVVPLNHDRPRQGTINLALMRRAANDQANRIGSVFLNPGGPGGSGYRLPTVGAQIFEPAVLDRFDLIGFDPRGVARSTPLRCFATQEDANSVFRRMVALPFTRQEKRDTIAANRDYGQFCERFAGPLLEHMSTEAVARDLDILRAAVGDRQLTYVGFSYGTLLGATYVNLFPNRARAIILDGNVDPKLRLLDGLEYDRQRTRGFELALDAMLTTCDTVGARCAFSDGNPRAKFDELRTYLRETGPIALPDGNVLTLTSLTGISGGALYSIQSLAPLAELLQTAYDVIHPSATGRKAAVSSDTVRALQANANRVKRDLFPDTPYTSDDSYAAVNCTDKPFAHRPNEVPSIADRWEREMPTYGRFLAWGDPMVCSIWPLDNPDAYRGPWNRRTPNPVMVIGNYYDPATQYEFARRMSRQLGNTYLLSVDSFGHCILGDSTCADRIAANYLIELRLPGPGTICHPDIQPFPLVQSGESGNDNRS